MNKILVIVESPGKIAKIKSILGDEYEVIASVGHVLDIDPSKTSIDTRNNFEPKYAPVKDKVIANLRANAAKAKDILIATDKDREGEQIAWSIASPYVLNLKNPKRIIFNSITKEELLRAVKNPVRIDENMVNSQKTRRVEDRLIGYEASPLLWKNIAPKLSAGRVQSVVVKIIIDKEVEIEQFYEKGLNSYFTVKAEFHDLAASLYDLKNIDQGGIYNGELTKLESIEEAKQSVRTLKKREYKVMNVIKKERINNPSPPFMTSTLQQESNSKLGMSIKRTMSAAQHLYEEGHITYMRTDCVNLSNEAMNAIKKYILAEFGKKMYSRRVYGSDKNAQEAHEAIRPTKISAPVVELKTGKIEKDEQRLYSLIWKRTIASQMEAAKYDVYSIQIGIIEQNTHFFCTKMERLIFPGFLKIYGTDEDKTKLSIPEVGKMLEITKLVAEEEIKNAPPRYSEASLVKKIGPKGLGIGRPSTYGDIINKMLMRGYVEIKSLPGEIKETSIVTWEAADGKTKIKKIETKIGVENKKFVPTELGRRVTDYLVTNFPSIMDCRFTAKMEDDLDKIARGELNWTKPLEEFYGPFHEKVVELGRTDPVVDGKYVRLLGKDPNNPEFDVVAMVSKYGPTVKRQLSKTTKKFYPIKEPYTFETITLEQAVELFKYPKELGTFNRKKVILNHGMYGYYLKCGQLRVNVSDDKKDIGLADAKKLLEGKNAKTALKEFKTPSHNYSIMDGPYGRYVQVKPIKKGKKINVKLPDSVKLEEVTAEKITNLLKKKKKI